ncbi:adhesion G protein-coupled receptor E3-like [Carcharodon carcharias]|uniref:adhesion G protein-coupled receptor E3-like n=1 Tax=Carcharodon carcharias TaxID=13397 RepID=UPI001B7D95F8|nr:adhesion G protein-coupled receptor E3-like [Carcharodon carcharias]
MSPPPPVPKTAIVKPLRGCSQTRLEPKSGQRQRNLILTDLTYSGKTEPTVFYWIIWNQNFHQSEGLHIPGKLGSSVTLPCSYDVNYYGLLSACWGQGCTSTYCFNTLLTTSGKHVTNYFESKYRLYGAIERGDLSLTIHNVSLEDEGLYCCRLEIPGLFNDWKQEITLSVRNDPPFQCHPDNKNTDSPAECRSDSQPSEAHSDSTSCHFMNWTMTFDREMCNSSDAVQKISVLSHLLSNLTGWQSLKDSERQKAASSLLQEMESAVITAAVGLLKEGRTKWTSPALDFEIGFIKRDNITGSDTMILQAKGDTVSVYPSTVIGDDASVTLVFISYRDMNSNIDANLVEEEHKNHRKLRKPQKSQFCSKVVTVTKGNRKLHKLNGTVNITFEGIQGKEEGVTSGGRVCAFWKTLTEGGYWSTAGCQLRVSNDTHIECSCSHLSSFAVLMALHEITDPLHNSILSWITFLGLPISLLCLLASIGTFFCCQSIQNLNTTIRAHLCLSLFLAETLFLIAIFINTQTVFCRTVAGCLHYLLLVAFAWMCLEAVQLCLMVLNLKVVNVSRTHVIQRKLMFLISYGCPAVIVVVSAAVNAKGYGTDKLCWLNLEDGFLWSFLGPVCFVILVNTILFSITLWILKGKISSLNAEVSKIKESRMLTFKAMAQFILLGCSWVFGLFQINEGTIVMSYLFTMLNVVQGIFIFIVYCLLNNKVRREYRMWFNRIWQPKRIETPDKYSSTSNIYSVVVLTTTNEPIAKSEASWIKSDIEEMREK